MKKQSKYILRAILLSAGVVLTAPVWAQKPTEQGAGAQYITGGVGVDEEHAMKAQRGHYNLRLLVTGKGGEFLASVPVKVLDNRQRIVIDTVTDGPLFYARLPAGQYLVVVGGQKQTVNLSAKEGTDLHIRL